VLTPGQVLLHLYHRPVGRIRDSLRHGGPIEEWRTAAGRRAMEKAAWSLAAPPAPAGPPVELHLLTGRRFWFQTAFCLHSFAVAAQRPVRPLIYDDGTLGEAQGDALLRIFPLGSIRPAAEIRDRLDRFLPASRFPVLRERWLNYPNLRKLIDPHLGSAGWKLVIDSDLLFFRRPGFLLDWAGRPDRLLHAVDCAESYGYSRSLMESLAGAAIPPLVNVGLCGLRSDALDWDLLEGWCAELIRRERTHYYLEQALVAMLAARAGGRAIAPAGDYLTKPAGGEAAQPRAVMHHYVAESKRWYFQAAWRRSPGIRAS
jgi:hypothetical protein